MDNQEYIVFVRTEWDKTPIEYSVARRCDHDGHTVRKDRTAAMPPLKLEIA